MAPAFTWREARDNGFLRKYDLSGNELWNRSLSADQVSAVAPYATGAYVAGDTFGGGAGGFLQKRSGTGEELWRRELPDDPFRLAVEAGLDQRDARNALAECCASVST